MDACGDGIRDDDFLTLVDCPSSDGLSDSITDDDFVEFANTFECDNPVPRLSGQYDIDEDEESAFAELAETIDPHDEQ